jgi:hypothetical protein
MVFPSAGARFDFVAAVCNCDSSSRTFPDQVKRSQRSYRCLACAGLPPQAQASYK